MKSALRKLFAASFAAFLLCCGTDDSSKGAGELCNASTECKKGLTCPNGKCQATCSVDEECTPIDSSYRCSGALCQKVNPYTCATDENTPYGNCSCQRDFATAGPYENPCAGLECCWTGVWLDPMTEEKLSTCGCFSTEYLALYGSTCDQYISQTTKKRVSKCPP